MHQCGSGAYCYLDTVENPDILVVVADFFTHVHSIKWVGVCGVYNDTVVVIFRGDGHVDLGEFAPHVLVRSVMRAGTAPRACRISP